MRKFNLQSTVNQRLVKLNSFEKNKGNQAVHSAIGIAGSTWNRIAKGSTQPSYETLLKIIFAYPNLNLYWLMLGEGEMWLPDEDIDEIKSGTYQNDRERKVYAALERMGATNDVLRVEIARKNEEIEVIKKTLAAALKMQKNAD